MQTFVRVSVLLADVTLQPRLRHLHGSGYARQGNLLQQQLVDVFFRFFAYDLLRRIQHELPLAVPAAVTLFTVMDVVRSWSSSHSRSLGMSPCLSLNHYFRGTTLRPSSLSSQLSLAVS